MWVWLIWKNLRSLSLNHTHITILTPQPQLHSECFVPRKFYCPEPNDSFKQNTHSLIKAWSHWPKTFCYMLTYTLISKHFPVLFSTFQGVDLLKRYKVEAPHWSQHFSVGLQNQNAGWQGKNMFLFSWLLEHWLKHQNFSDVPCNLGPNPSFCFCLYMITRRTFKFIFHYHSCCSTVIPTQGNLCPRGYFCSCLRVCGTIMK